MKTDALGYAIGGVFNQLTTDDTCQLHPIVFFLRKMILAKT